MNQGWNEFRHVDIRNWISTLENEGFKSNIFALRILKSFGNLIIKTCDYDKLTSHYVVNFNPITASGEFDRLENWENAAQTSLFPLGEITNELLMVDETGSLYVATWDLDLYQIGFNFSDSLKNILLPYKQFNKIK